MYQISEKEWTSDCGKWAISTITGVPKVYHLNEQVNMNIVDCPEEVEKLYENLKEDKKMKVLDTCKVGGFKFAIIAEGKRAYEAVWNDEIQDWDTDFSYEVLGVDSFDVAGMMDFDGVEEQGYKFVD